MAVTPADARATAMSNPQLFVRGLKELATSTHSPYLKAMTGLALDIYEVRLSSSTNGVDSDNPAQNLQARMLKFSTKNAAELRSRHLQESLRTASL